MIYWGVELGIIIMGLLLHWLLLGSAYRNISDEQYEQYQRTLRGYNRWKIGTLLSLILLLLLLSELFRAYSLLIVLGGISFFGLIAILSGFYVSSRLVSAQLPGDFVFQIVWAEILLFLSLGALVTLPLLELKDLPAIF